MRSPSDSGIRLIIDGVVLPEPLTFRAVDEDLPVIVVGRKPCRGDPRLPSVRIRLAA